MGPFEALRVIDLSPNRVGAQISQLFADFGADVIQVEPRGGASIRQRAAFPFWARGKRSIVLDVSDPTDRDLVRALSRTADVLIETQEPGVLDALGLGYSDLAPDNKRLIYTSVTGFGRRGPYASAPGYEGIVHAKLGLFNTFQRMTPHAEPPYVHVPFASFAASQVALHGTLAALIERESSGFGQLVETNMAQALISLDTWAWFEYFIGERWPGAYTRSTAYDVEGRPLSPLSLMLLVSATKDGTWLQFASVAQRLFAALMKAIGLDWMFTDPEWQGLPAFGDDVVKRAELWRRMHMAVRSKTLHEWEQIFAEDSNVFAEQFRSGPNTLEHPQLLHDGFVVELVDDVRGPVRQPGAIVKAVKTPADLSRSAPTLDRDRADVLALLGPARATSRAAGSAAAPQLAPAKLPLEGVTVLELATLFAAPHGTTMLTDLGARVIKIEPLEGDMIRRIIPFPESGGAKVMQGKESLAIDMSTAEGNAIVRELAGTVDVIVQGYRAGAMARLSLDYASVKLTNPDVVYVNAPGYGVDGPYGDKPAYAPSIGAASGQPLANLGATVPDSVDLTTDELLDTARRLSAACSMANAQADGIAALGVTTAILFGLAVRRRGGGGQELFSSMLSTNGHAMSAQAVTYPGAPHEPAPLSDLRGLGALYRIYDTADGYVFLAAPSSRDWSRLTEALSPYIGLDADERFSSSSCRDRNCAALIAVLADAFMSKPAAEWERELLAQGVGCVQVHTGLIEEQLFDDSFGRAGGYVADVVHPIFDEHLRPAPYIQFSRSLTQALPGVLAGQHTDQILAAAGKSPDVIADLRARKIVA